MKSIELKTNDVLNAYALLGSPQIPLIRTVSLEHSLKRQRQMERNYLSLRRDIRSLMLSSETT